MKKASQDIFEPEIPVVPSDWVVLPFEQAADVVSDKGKRVKQGSYLLAGKIPIIDQGQDAIGGYTDDENMAFDDELPVILFGDHTRSFKYIDKRFAVGAEGVKILRPRERYVPKFFYYLLRSLQIPSRGYSRHFQFLRKFHLPLAPEEQQRDIVAEIEKQFSRLDEAVANLKRVKANLKRYKAAVLKAAVDGKLTIGTNMVVPTPFSELIEGLSQGWSPKCELSRDPLPNEWAIIKTTAVQSMRYLDSESKPLPSKFAPRSNIEIKAGDFLMTRKGPRQRAGVACLVRKTRSRLMVCDTVYRFRCKESRVIPAYLELALNSPLIVSEIDRRKSGISDSGVSLTHDKLGSVLVPIPQLAEQERIVAEVERRLSVIEELQGSVQANLTRAERLRQGVLTKAFSGELVAV